MSCTVSRRKPPRSPASHNLLKPCPSPARWNGSPSRRNCGEPQCRVRRRLTFAATSGGPDNKARRGRGPRVRIHLPPAASPRTIGSAVGKCPLGRYPCRVVNVLEANRDTVQRAAMAAGRDFDVGGPRRRQRIVVEHPDIGVQRLVEPLDAGEIGPGSTRPAIAASRRSISGVPYTSASGFIYPTSLPVETPEPSSAIVLMGSLIGFGFIRRRLSARRTDIAEQCLA